jgi:beta-lactamase class A
MPSIEDRQQPPARWPAEGLEDRQQRKDVSGDIAIAWPKVGGPVLICVYTQGGSPTPPQFEAIFAEVGRMVGRKMG